MKALRLVALAFALLLPAALFGQGAPAQLFPLPVFTEKQIRQLVSDLASQLEMTAGFHRAAPAEAAASQSMPYPPSVVPAAVIVRGDDHVRLGFVVLPRRLPQLWVQGLRRQAGTMVSNPAAAAPVEAAMRTVLAESAKIMGRLRLSDLETRSVLLSYVDADAALFVLRAMGFSAITDTESLPRDDWYKGDDPSVAVAPEPPPGAMSSAMGGGMPPSSYSYGMPGAVQGPKFPAIKNLPTTINFDRLPLVIRVPSTDPRNMGVVGAEAAPSAYSYATPATTSAIPTVAQPLTETISAGTQELLVLFHPDYPEQFQKVRKVLQDSIDRPARQVLVEGLVVEVSKGNFDRLGIQWAGSNRQTGITLGTVGPQANTIGLPFGSALTGQRNELASGIGRDPSSTGLVIPITAGPWSIYARIEALVSEDKAQILSRPSLVTLDNRQATIRVGNDIPVATAVGANNNIGYTYRNVPIGIMLNVRPRVSEDGTEISMLIDATVSDTVRGQDLRVVDPDTNSVVVSAPTISTRRVQTYARIRDNMPLIIGGLISRTTVKEYDRVPLLGNIPFVGALFGHTVYQTEVREVIIVLTPSVVNEDSRLAKSQSPKHDPLFDVTGTTLFREKLRIGSEDVADSTHLRTNERFLRYREAANRAIDRQPELAAMPPFSQFTGARVPGDASFVTGLMYRMLDRVKAGDAIAPQALRVFEKDASGLPRPASLAAMLDSFLERNPGKALALTFRTARGSGVADLMSETIPEVRLVDCATREDWRRTLWEANQPDERGPRATILIRDREDVRRLQIAVATRNTILANGGERAMTLDFWIAGRMLNVQEITPHWERVVEADVARDFFVGEHYYGYSMQEHLRALEALEHALQPPKVSRAPE